MQTKITLRSLETQRRAAQAQSKSTYVWDTELRGFGAYVSPKGEVSWLVQRWVGGRGGRAIRSVIGKATEISIDEARRRAAVDLGSLNDGVNIVAQKRAKRKAIQEEITAPSVLSAFETYIQRKSKHTRYWVELEASVRQAIKSLPRGESTPCREVTKAELRSLLYKKEHVQGAPVAARNLFAALRPFFAWCVEQDIITASPIMSLSAPNPPMARDRVLTEAELILFWKATERLAYPFKHYFRLLLLTGQRREEVAAMRLEEIDLSKSVWTIPSTRTKNGRGHIVHLSPFALSILNEALSEQQTETSETQPFNRRKCPFVFTTTGKTAISGYSKAKRRLDATMLKVAREEADKEGRDQELVESITITEWRTHDLRRTMTSFLASLGTPTDVADRILNHVSGSRGGVKGVYQRYEFLTERQRALEAWGQWVSETVQDAQPLEIAA